VKSHSYLPRRARITKRTVLCDATVSLRLEFGDGKPFHFTPGQFVMLSVLGYGEVPIGITTSPKEKNYIEVAVHSVGMVTQKIWGLTEGDVVGINGPFGNGFNLNAIKNKRVFLVSGGVGLAPLRSLIHHLEDEPSLVKSLDIIYGARCPDKLLYKDEYKNWEEFASFKVTVDEKEDGWRYDTGNIIELLDKTEVPPGAVMIICGPPPMLNILIKRYAGKRVAEKDMYFMLERRMKCGVGKCQHCTCGKEYVCLDGPVFSYEQLKYNKEAFLYHAKN
jgi:sulfhydrogenase subunit gamma (sulfur reductase)